MQVKSYHAQPIDGIPGVDQLSRSTTASALSRSKRCSDQVMLPGKGAHRHASKNKMSPHTEWHWLFITLAFASEPLDLNEDADASMAHLDLRLAIATVSAPTISVDLDHWEQLPIAERVGFEATGINLCIAPWSL
jgi:hypothetical protein